MASYHTHLSVSGLVGVGYAVAAHGLCGFSAVHSAHAGCLTGFLKE